jgi:ParB-like chromosome segregation protein Spo0J
VNAIASLPLGSISRDAAIHPRVAGIDESHVAALMKTPDAWPPLAVVEDCGHYILVDGFHRYAAAERLGMEAVAVQIVPMPADRDLRGLAVDLNLRREACEGIPLFQPSVLFWIAHEQLSNFWIADERLNTAARIAAARAGMSERAFIIDLLMADEGMRESLAYVDPLASEGRPE